MTDTPRTIANTPTTKPRYDGFDALRGGAMLLGIVLHAAITYMQRPMSGLVWPLSNQPTHAGFDALFWWIHGWRIPLFFVMAGFFAAMLARRRGAGGFLKHRYDRIIKPVAIASVTILPAMFYLWAWGWWLEGRITGQEILDVKFDDPQIQAGFLGPAHLWFLYYLGLYSLVYWAVLKVRGDRSAGDEPGLARWARGCFVSPLRPVWFALPTFGFLLVTPDFYLGYHHVFPRSLSDLGYELMQLAYQGWFFVVGVYFFRLHRDMEPIKRGAWVYLALAQLVFIGCLPMIETGMSHPHTWDDWAPVHRYGLPLGIALFCWLMIWGLTGLGLTVLAKPRYWVRWLSDSAYWVYLVHLPIVAVLLIWMKDWPLGPWVKFALIVAVTSAATLLSYRYWVRYTLIGRLLNGPRSKERSDFNAKTPRGPSRQERQGG